MHIPAAAVAAAAPPTSYFLFCSFALGAGAEARSCTFFDGLVYGCTVL